MPNQDVLHFSNFFLARFLERKHYFLLAKPKMFRKFHATTLALFIFSLIDKRTLYMIIRGNNQC